MTYKQQETHHGMRIPERDKTYIVISVYLLTLIHRYSVNRKQSHWHKVNLIQLKTFEIVLQYTDVRIADLCLAHYIPSTE